MMQRLNSFVRGTAITGTKSLSSLGDNPSGTADLLMFKLTRDSATRGILSGRLQIPALVQQIFKFEKCVQYGNEMTDDVIYSTQNNIMYINRAILANLQRRAMKLGRLIVLQKTHLRL